MLSPEEDPSFVSESRVKVSGQAPLDAVVSVNDEIVDVNDEGLFEAMVELEEGPNVVEVVASNAGGDETSAVLTVFYLP